MTNFSDKFRLMTTADIKPETLLVCVMDTDLGG